MTCKCRTLGEHEERLLSSFSVKKSAILKQLAEAEEKNKTPDNTQYEIVEIFRVGEHVVLKVLYPNCRKCSYEGNKIMVFLNVSEVQLVKWRVIDPHFREGTSSEREAPSPAARFPASAEGMEDALAYARSKMGRRTR